MTALVYHAPDDLRLEAREVPEPGAGAVVVRVEACGVCGTDLRIAGGKHRAYGAGVQRVPGHEIVGTVAAVGEGADARVGERVVVAPNVGCGVCRECRDGRLNLCHRAEALGITRDGAFADHVLVGADAVGQGNLLRAPQDADPAVLTLVEPLACVLRGQRPLRVGPEDVVLVMGAGPIGLMHIAVARAAGPACVIVSEPSGARREQALAHGADVAVDPAADDLAAIVRERSDGRGADVVVTAAPAPAAQVLAIELAAPGGRINFFGGLAKGTTVQLDTNAIHYKELLVTGTTANTTEDCREALELVLSGRIDPAPLVSERYPLQDAHEALRAAGSGEALKVVVVP